MHLVLGLIVFCLLVVLLLLAPKIDQNPRVDGSEWRIKPSQSGKTWEAYRYAGGLGIQERRTRFPSPAAAAAWVRAHGMRRSQVDAQALMEPWISAKASPATIAALSTEPTRYRLSLIEAADATAQVELRCAFCGSGRVDVTAVHQNPYRVTCASCGEDLGAFADVQVEADALVVKSGREPHGPWRQSRA